MLKKMLTRLKRHPRKVIVYRIDGCMAEIRTEIGRGQLERFFQQPVQGDAARSIRMADLRLDDGSSMRLIAEPGHVFEGRDLDRIADDMQDRLVFLA